MFVMLITLLMTKGSYAQKIKLTDSNLVANKVYMTTEKLQGKAVVKVIKDSTIREVDEPTFVRVKNIDFKNGVIEVDVLSRLLPTASPTDRGFIGLAFRINDSNSKFECIYIRPTNGRADDQLRRTTQFNTFLSRTINFQG